MACGRRPASHFAPFSSGRSRHSPSECQTMTFHHRFRKCHFRMSLALAGLIAAAILPVSPAAAISVKPAVIDMTAASGQNQTITVVNDSAKPLPIEILASRMELNENGDSTTKPAGDDFLIFPPQALVRPGATQNFRVQWVGDPQLRQAQSYVLSVNQVPVRMGAGSSGVQVVFNFATIVNVAPAGGKAAITLVSAAPGKDDKGKPRPALTVRNPGNSYANLTDATISLSSGSWSATLRPDQLRQTMGIGLVQPGKTRRFLLPVDLPANAGPITASIDYKPPR
jgi:fimbrial chaperone protein